MLLALFIVFVLVPAQSTAVVFASASSKVATDVTGMERFFANSVLAQLQETGGQARQFLIARKTSPAENIVSSPETQNVKNTGGIRVAEIEGRGYTSLQNAVNMVQEGQTIKLMVAGHTLSAAVTIDMDTKTSFTFDLNGYTLGSRQGVISHLGSGTLTVIDSMNSQSAKITTSSQYNNTIEILRDGILVIESGTIEHAGEGATFVGAIHGYGYGGVI